MLNQWHGHQSSILSPKPWAWTSEEKIFSYTCCGCTVAATGRLKLGVGDCNRSLGLLWWGVLESRAQYYAHRVLGRQRSIKQFWLEGSWETQEYLPQLHAEDTSEKSGLLFQPHCFNQAWLIADWNNHSSWFNQDQLGKWLNQPDGWNAVVSTVWSTS